MDDDSDYSDLDLGLSDDTIAPMDVSELESNAWSPEQRLAFWMVFRAMVDLLERQQLKRDALTWFLDPVERPYPPWSYPWCLAKIEKPIEVFDNAILGVLRARATIHTDPVDTYSAMYGKFYGIVWRELNRSSQEYALGSGEEYRGPRENGEPGKILSGDRPIFRGGYQFKKQLYKPRKPGCGRATPLGHTRNKKKSKRGPGDEA